MKLLHRVSFGLFLAYLPGNAYANAEICGASGEKAAQLEKQGDLTTAVWCYTNAKNWRAAVALEKKVIPSSLARIGEGNYALVVSQLALSHLELKNYAAGRKVLEQGMSQLAENPAVIHTAYNVSKLFHDKNMRSAERMRWHALLLQALAQPRPQNQLIDCFTANAYFGIDQGVREKKNEAALQMARDAIEKYDADMTRHWAYLRDMIRIQYLALSHDAAPKPARRKLKMLFLIVPETRLSENHAQFGNLSEKLDEADVQELLFNFRYFASAFQAMTGIGWEHRIVRHRGAVTKTTYLSDPPRSVMHPEMKSIEPALPDSTLKEILNSDAVTLVWAGTRQPRGHLITNGGGTEYGFTIGGRDRIRMLIPSDSNKRYLDGNHANSALFFFHEMFHVLEWAYYKADFPKTNHPFQRRHEWPADYQGGTEFDFYYETYKKRFLPEDGLARVEWRSDHMGFHNRMIQKK